MKLISLEDAPMEVVDRWLWEQCRQCAEDWFLIQSRNNYAQVYLWYRRGELAVAEEKPIGTGFELGHSSRINPGWTKDQVKFWIRGIAAKLPCLPERFRVEK